MAKKFKEVSEEAQKDIVLGFVRSQISHAWLPQENITESSRFCEDLDMTDLDVAMLMHDVELEFGIPFLSDDKADDITTVGDLVLFVVEKLSPVV